jgi:hypothetical protein
MRTVESFKPLNIKKLQIKDINNLINSDKLIIISIDDALNFCELCIRNKIYILGCDALDSTNYNDINEYIIDLSNTYTVYLKSKNYKIYSSDIFNAMQCYINDINTNNIKCVLEFTISL